MKKYCTIIDGYFVLHGEDDFEYDIKINRINNQSDLNGWIEHLSEKSWVHPEMLKDFISTVSKEKGWEAEK